MKKLLAMLLTLSMVLSMTACSQTDEQTGTQTGESELQKLTISTHPSGHGLPVYVAQQQGWFEEEGLDVETLVYIAAAPQMEAYATGAWDIGTTGFGGIVLGTTQNDLKVVGVSVDDACVMGFWAKEDSPIAQAGVNSETGFYGTADDWAGKETLLAKGTVSEILLSVGLSKLGLSGDDVTMMNMDASTAITAFKSNSGDLTQGDSAFYFNAEQEGWTSVLTGPSVDLYIPAAIMASDSILEESPETVEKWIRAYMKGVEYIIENPEEAAQMMVEFCEANGVATTLENSTRFVEMQYAEIPNAAEQVELFDTSSGESQLQNQLGLLMDEFISMGGYTEEVKESMLDSSNFISDYMDAVK